MNNNHQSEHQEQKKPDDQIHTHINQLNIINVNISPNDSFEKRFPQ